MYCMREEREIKSIVCEIEILAQRVFADRFIEVQTRVGDKDGESIVDYDVILYSMNNKEFKNFEMEMMKMFNLEQGMIVVDSADEEGLIELTFHV